MLDTFPPGKPALPCTHFAANGFDHALSRCVAAPAYRISPSHFVKPLQKLSRFPSYYTTFSSSSSSSTTTTTTTTKASMIPDQVVFSSCCQT